MKKRILKKMLAVSLAATTMFSLVGCLDDEDFEEFDQELDAIISELEETPEDSGSTVNVSRSATLTLNNSGNLSIVRANKGKDTPMGEDGTWTIFVYMCGSDLESNYGLASGDLQEMMDAYTDSNVKFVVQTGGASAWENGLDEDCLSRVVITEGEGNIVDEIKKASMGDAQTFYDFLNWGVSNYPAEHMGVVFWNHGGGSIAGVCFDENDDWESLSIREIDSCFLSVTENMTDKFEFIGCDACLMGTIEFANMAANYAEYMVCSEETEPGYGWDYVTIGEFLDKNPRANGAEVGKVICDSFYDSCAQTGEEDTATLSVIDLARLDDLMIAYNDYFMSVYNGTNDASSIAATMRNINNVENFGGNNKSEGYTNMVDLGGIVRACSDFGTGADNVLTALNNAVVYQKVGREHRGASGLSTYYPLELSGSSELSTFGEIAVSPYYLGMVQRTVEASMNGGDLSSYDVDSTIEDWGAFEYQTEEDGTYYYDDSNVDYDYYSDYEGTESDLITFYMEPGYDEDGMIAFMFDESGLEYAYKVVADVLMVLDDDYENVIDLGEVADFYMDWEYGYGEDGFDGLWYALDDGQFIAVYLVDETEDYAVYTSPIYLNGERTNLRFKVYSDYTIEVDGAWDGIDDNGMASPVMHEIKDGDVIIPLYNDAYNYDEDEMYCGNEYYVDGWLDLTYEYLDDGEYWYSFVIDDIYGDYYISDYLSLYIEDGEIYTD